MIFSTDMEYVAYIDESFDSFFDLSRDDGYFCMGIFLMPVLQISAFEALFLSYRQTLSCAKASNDDGALKSELKSKHLRTISDQVRRSALAPILAWASEVGAAVGGFYTSTNGYVRYSMRSDAACEQVINPPLDHPERMAQARVDIQSRRSSEPAESLMIGDVAQAVASMLLYYCGERQMEFSIVYDPRSHKEDMRVFERIEQLIVPLQVPILGRDGVFLGCNNTLSSEKSAGLQFVDHVTRDLRALFRVHPRLLTDEMSDELITSEVTSIDRTMITHVGGMPFKWGDTRPMGSDLVDGIFDLSSPFSLADYHSILMKQRISCYSEAGEARITNFENFSFDNMVD